MALLAAAAFGGSASATPATGVVVGSTHGTLLVATPSGLVRSVQGRLAVGTRVALDGAQVTAIGRTHSARIRGVVVRNRGSLTFLSAASHVLVVHRTRTLASAGDTSQPQPGSVVQTTVGIDDQGDLDEQSEQAVGQTQQVPVQATVAAVGAGTVTLSVNGQSLTVALPAGLTLPATLVGTTVTLNVSFAASQPTAVGGDDEEQGDDDNGGASGGFSFGQTFGHGDHHGGGGDD